MALPRDARELNKNKGFVLGLGKNSPIERKGVFDALPKPSDPPEKGNAALSAKQDGAKSIQERLATRLGIEDTAPAFDAQSFRAAWLMRRAAVAPDMAKLLASLALGEVGA